MLLLTLDCQRIVFMDDFRFAKIHVFYLENVVFVKFHFRINNL